MRLRPPEPATSPYLPSIPGFPGLSRVSASPPGIRGGGGGGGGGIGDYPGSQRLLRNPGISPCAALARAHHVTYAQYSTVQCSTAGRYAIEARIYRIQLVIFADKKAFPQKIYMVYILAKFIAILG